MNVQRHSVAGLLCAWLTALCVAAADAPPPQWARYIPSDGIAAPKLLSDGAGGFFIYSAGNRPLIKFDANHNISWEVDFARGVSDVNETVSLGKMDDDSFVGLFRTAISQANIGVFGQSMQSAPQFIVRFRADGSPIEILPATNCTLTAMAVAPNGYVITGFGSGIAKIGTQAIDLGTGKLFVARFSPSLVWTVFGAGTSKVGSDSIQSITPLPQAGALLLDASLGSASFTFGDATFTGPGRRLLEVSLDGSSAKTFADPVVGITSISASNGRVTIAAANSVVQFDEFGNLNWEDTGLANQSGVTAGTTTLAVGTDPLLQSWSVAAVDEFGNEQWRLVEPSRVSSTGEALETLSDGQVVFTGLVRPEGIFLNDAFAGDFSVIEQIGYGLFVAGIDPSPTAPPAFRVQPKSQRRAIAGEHVELVADVYSPTTASLQWFKDGAPLDGQNQSTLVIASAGANDAGAYWLEAESPFGTTRSTTAEVIVNTVSVSTLAGSGEAGLNNNPDPKLGQFNAPQGILFLPNGAILVADTTNSVIRRIDSDGLSTFAGSGQSGNSGGDPAIAKFAAPSAIAARFYPTEGAEVFVVDTANHNIRSISYSPNTAAPRSVSEHELTQSFATPIGIATAPGLPYLAVADSITPTIWRFEEFFSTRWAGNSASGNLDGPLIDARFGDIAAVAMDLRGNVYIADRGNSSLRRIAPDGVVTTIASAIEGLSGISADENGFVYAISQNRVLKISPTGIVTPVAGQITSGFADGAAAEAQFDSPKGIAISSAGRLLVADTMNHRIREIRFTPNATSAPTLEITLGALLNINVKGDPSQRFAIESAASISPGAQWTAEGSTDGGGSLQLVRPASVRFYRARQN